MIHAICFVFAIELPNKPLIDINGLSKVFDFHWGLFFCSHGNNVLDLQCHSYCFAFRKEIALYLATIQLLTDQTSSFLVENLASPWAVSDQFKSWVQIFSLVVLFRTSYLSVRWIRLSIALSNWATRLVVRKMMPLQYSSLRRKTETRPLRTRFWFERRSR